MAKFTITISVGSIIKDATEAETKCPIVCAAHLGTWTGIWSNVGAVEDEQMGVCNCECDTEHTGSNQLIINVLAGAVMSQEEATVKCPIVCASYGGEWTGKWTTPQKTWGKMSTCECKFNIS